jgi:hypothetical protein
MRIAAAQAPSSLARPLGRHSRRRAFEVLLHDPTTRRGPQLQPADRRAAIRSGAQAMEWNDYEVFDPGVDRPLAELPRKQARAAFDRLMAAREERLVQLRRLAAANGVDLDAADGVQRLNDWFVASVQPDPEGRGRLANVWYSVVNDIGLFLGERAFAASGGKLRWEFFTAGRKDVAYQRHVLIGFDVPNPRYNMDLDLVVGMYGHRVVRGEDVDPAFFTGLLRAAAERS